jgi:hypothetical protein
LFSDTTEIIENLYSANRPDLIIVSEAKEKLTTIIYTIQNINSVVVALDSAVALLTALLKLKTNDKITNEFIVSIQESVTCAINSVSQFISKFIKKHGVIVTKYDKINNTTNNNYRWEHQLQKLSYIYNEMLDNCYSFSSNEDIHPFISLLALFIDAVFTLGMKKTSISSSNNDDFAIISLQLFEHLNASFVKLLHRKDNLLPISNKKNSKSSVKSKKSQEIVPLEESWSEYLVLSLFRCVSSCCCSVDLRNTGSDGQFSPAQKFINNLSHQVNILLRENLLPILKRHYESNNIDNHSSYSSLTILMVAECIRILIKGDPILNVNDENNEEENQLPLLEIDCLLFRLSMNVSSNVYSLVDLCSWQHLVGTVLLAHKALRRPLSPSGSNALLPIVRDVILNIARMHRQTTNISNQSNHIKSSLYLHFLGGEESTSIKFDDCISMCLRGMIECYPEEYLNGITDMLEEFASCGNYTLANYSLHGAINLLEARKNPHLTVLSACRILEHVAVIYPSSKLDHSTNIVHLLLSALRTGLSRAWKNHQQTQQHRKDKNIQLTKEISNNDEIQSNIDTLTLFVTSTINILSTVACRLSQYSSSTSSNLAKIKSELCSQLISVLDQLLGLPTSLPILSNLIGSISMILRQCLDTILRNSSGKISDTSILVITTGKHARVFSRCLHTLSSSNSLKKHVHLTATVIIEVLSQHNVASTIKEMLMPGLFCLLEQCRSKEKQHISRLLDDASRALYTDIHQVYLQDWKFQG